MIKPSWSLREILGDGVAFNPVPCFEQSTWLPPARADCDALTMAQLVLAGDTPIVCHAAAATPRTLRLLADAGHAPPRRARTYTTRAEYRAVLDSLAREGWRIAVTHAQADHVLPDDRLLVPNALLRSLNDKGELERVAPAPAARRRIPAAEFAALDVPALPCVVKVASRQSSGAGFGVRVCRTRHEFRRAQVELAPAPAVVLEEWLDIAVSWCVQFVVAPDGAVAFLGAAEQVIDADGRWWGNWIDGIAPDTVVRLGRAAAKAGAERGYRGVVGIDVARCADGRLRVLDANFRFNGSTVALLFQDALVARGLPVVRSRGFAFDGSFEEMERAIRGARAFLLPTGAWDPAEGPPRIRALVAGASREEVSMALDALARAGFG